MVISIENKDGCVGNAEAKDAVEKFFAENDYSDKRVVMVLPDNTRSGPVGDIFKMIFDSIGKKVKALDILIALGTHQPMTEEQICTRLNITPEQHKNEYDDKYLAEMYGPSYIASELSTYDEDMKNEYVQLLEEYQEEEAAVKFIQDHDLEEDLSTWILEETNFGDLREIYSLEDLEGNITRGLFEKVLNEVFYPMYMKTFSSDEEGDSLEEQIVGVKGMYERLLAVEGANIQDQILTFQEGLTTAHHHGTMADHLVWHPDMTGTEFLDSLSSGPHIEAWNADLATSLGHTPGEGYKPQNTQTYYDPESRPQLRGHIAKFNELFKRVGNITKIAGIHVEDLERIYELTYIYQMLTREQNIGDYGVPQTLPDQAYNEYHKTVQRLRHLFVESFDGMRDAYDIWIERHSAAPEWFSNDVYDEFYDRAYDVHRGWESLSDALSFSDDLVHETIVEALKFHLNEEDWLEDPNPQMTEYNTTSFDDMNIEQLEDVIDRVRKSDGDLATNIIDRIFQEVAASPEFDIYMQDVIDTRMEGWDDETQLGAVKEMREKLETADELELDDQITLFQEALTTAHNNGEMSEYIIEGMSSSSAVSFLDYLSHGEYVDQLDADLAKVLGYPMGSRLHNPEIGKYSALNASLEEKLNQIRVAIAGTVQDVYELWEADRKMQPIYGAGAISDDVAEAVSDTITEYYPDVGVTVEAGSGNHMYTIAFDSTGAFAIDIPHKAYKQRGGYRNVADTIIDPQYDVQIMDLNLVPEELEQLNMEQGIHTWIDESTVEEHNNV